MPRNCCIKGCGTNALKNWDKKFYLLPQIRKKPKLRDLSVERQNKWLAAINRKKLNIKIARVCCRHFVSGKVAKLCDRLNPDWVPSLHMGSSPQFEEVIIEGNNSEVFLNEEYLDDYLEEVEPTQESILTKTDAAPEPSQKSIGPQLSLRKEFSTLYSELREKDLDLERHKLEILKLRKENLKLNRSIDFILCDLAPR